MSRDSLIIVFIMKMLKCVDIFLGDEEKLLKIQEKLIAV